MNSIEKKILIIDDDASLTEMYGMKFEIDGWNVQKVHE